MNAGPTWVVGARGLLGSHVAEALRSSGNDVMSSAVTWSDAEQAKADLRVQFRELLSQSTDGRWNIAWCAGAGVVATSREQLLQELDVYSSFLEEVASTGGRGGALFLASSAGGVYAGSPDAPPFDERSHTRPLAAYGEIKLAMEEATTELARSTGTAVFIGRIANLYGPGQNLAKQQGLISQLARAHATRQPATIYVPVDTIRDYLFVSDCAEMVAHGLLRVREMVAGQECPVVTKILASGQGTTIGSLLGQSARMFKRRTPVVVKAPRPGSGQARDLRFRSEVWCDLDRHARTSLPVGFAATAEDVRRRLREAT